MEKDDFACYPTRSSATKNRLDLKMHNNRTPSVDIAVVNVDVQPYLYVYNINIKVFFTSNTRIRPFTAVFGPPPSRPAPEISYTRYGRPRFPPVHEPLLDGRARTRDGWQPYFSLILVWHLLPESHAVKRRGGFAYWMLLYSLRFPELSTNFHEGWSTF